MTITLIIGLPGSGKTFYAKTLNGVLVDDPISLNELPEICDHLIITDSSLCNKVILDYCINVLKLKYNNSKIEKIYFENDPDQCIKNSNTRENKHVEHYIHYLSNIYIPDISCKIIPCYKNN